MGLKEQFIFRMPILEFFIKHRTYYGGASVMQIFQSSIQFGGDNTGEYSLKRNYNLIAGYVYEINDEFMVEPSLLLKIPTSAKPQLDLNARVYYKAELLGRNFLPDRKCHGNFSGCAV